MNSYLVKLTLIKNVREEVPAAKPLRGCIGGSCRVLGSSYSVKGSSTGPRMETKIVEKKMDVERTVKADNKTFALIAALNEFPFSRVLRVDVDLVECSVD
jgi:hypothetical protein